MKNNEQKIGKRDYEFITLENETRKQNTNTDRLAHAPYVFWLAEAHLASFVLAFTLSLG